MDKLSQDILDNGVAICKHWRANIDLIKRGSMIPGLILVYWQIKKETGSISAQADRRDYWERAKQLRPEANKHQLIDTAIALFVYKQITGENL